MSALLGVHTECVMSSMLLLSKGIVNKGFLHHEALQYRLPDSCVAPSVVSCMLVSLIC